MELRFDLPNHFETELQQIVIAATHLAIEESKKTGHTKEWMTLKEGAAYAGVSYNSFMKFRIYGLKICEVEGVKRVSKTEIDRFFIERSN